MQGPDVTARNSALDGIRALACLAVVACHAGVPGAGQGGMVGVEVFFALSGYLMTGIIQRRLAARRFDYLDFLAERFRRLVPALVLMLVGVVIETAVLAPDALPGVLTSCLDALMFSMDLSRAHGVIAPLLAHTWTLGVEMQFYVFWPMVLAAVRVLPRPWIILAAAGATLAVLAAVLPVRLAEPVPWAFCLGGALAVLGLGPPEGDVIARALSAPILVALGRLSYGVYLWHFPIVETLRGAPWEFRLVIGGGLSTLLAALSYLTIERWAGCAKTPLWPSRSSVQAVTEAAA